MKIKITSEVDLNVMSSDTLRDVIDAVITELRQRDELLGENTVKLIANCTWRGQHQSILNDIAEYSKKVGFILDWETPMKMCAPQSKTDLTFDEAQYLVSGAKIRAIKLYRDRVKVGLAEAKAAVDTFEAKVKVMSWDDMTAFMRGLEGHPYKNF